MGCPVPKVVRNGEGSALMKDPKRIYDIVYKTARAIKKPVTIKIRKGFDDTCINAPEIAKVAEEAECSGNRSTWKDQRTVLLRKCRLGDYP